MHVVSHVALPSGRWLRASDAWATHEHSPPEPRSEATEQSTLLVRRQQEYLPAALAEMRQHGRKHGHWAWWAFPTELVGMSEPPPGTCVDKHTAQWVLQSAPPVWLELLELICDLTEEQVEARGDGENVLPAIDHGRVKFFVSFWSGVDATPDRMKAILRRLGASYGVGASTSAA